jgi:hypothetical protein
MPCGSEDPAIAELQGLPDSYYDQLFREVEASDCKSRCRLPALDKLENLATRTIYLQKSGSKGSATLKFCFDEGLSLKFRGLGTDLGEIWVAWGGSPPSYGEALLWSRSAAVTQMVNYSFEPAAEQALAFDRTSLLSCGLTLS